MYSKKLFKQSLKRVAQPAFVECRDWIECRTEYWAVKLNIELNAERKLKQKIEVERNVGPCGTLAGADASSNAAGRLTGSKH